MKSLESDPILLAFHSLGRWYGGSLQSPTSLDFLQLVPQSGSFVEGSLFESYAAREDPDGGSSTGGLHPNFSEDIRVKILPGKSGLFGADWGLFRAYRGLLGADQDQFLGTSQPRGRAEIGPKGTSLA